MADKDEIARLLREISGLTQVRRNIMLQALLLRGKPGYDEALARLMAVEKLLRELKREVERMRRETPLE